MSGVALPSKPEDPSVTEQMFRELKEVKVEDGVEYDPKSLLAQQWIERTQESPSTLYDENVPWRFWKIVAAHIKAICRRTATAELRESREVALAYARSLVKERVAAMTPMRSQLDLFDMLMFTIPEGASEEMVLHMRGRFDEVLRCWREACYVCMNNEYLARGVGG